jgi:hypothetical protein
LDRWDNIADEEDEVSPFDPDDSEFLQQHLRMTSVFINKILNATLGCTTFDHVKTTAINTSVKDYLTMLGEDTYLFHVHDLRKMYFLGQALHDNTSVVFATTNYTAEWYILFRQSKLKYRNQVEFEEREARKALRALETSYEEETIQETTIQVPTPLQPRALYTGSPVQNRTPGSDSNSPTPSELHVHFQDHQDTPSRLGSPSFVTFHTPRPSSSSGFQIPGFGGGCTSQLFQQP